MGTVFSSFRMNARIACLACVGVFFGGVTVAWAQSPESPAPVMPPPPESASPNTLPEPPQTPEPPKPAEPSASIVEFVPTSFQLSGLGVFQSGGNSFSPEIGWTPRLLINDRFAIKLAFDGAVLKGVGSNFVSLDYQAFLSWGPPNIKLDLGGGGQTWFTQGTEPMGTVQVEIALDPVRFLGLFDRVIAGYSFYPVPYRATNEVTIGGGIEF